MPGRYPKDGDRLRCISEGYKCAGAGYRYATVRASGWPWQKYGGAQASYDSFGPHNCTLYVAYRLKKNGWKNPRGWSDNAGSWYRHISRRRVNERPAIGAGRGVARAFRLRGSRSVLRASRPATTTTATTGRPGRRRQGKRSLAESLSPPRRQGTTVAGRLQKRHLLVESLERVGRELVGLDSSGNRHLIRSRSTYRCLRRHGVENYGLQPDRIVNQLPEPAKRPASCR